MVKACIFDNIMVKLIYSPRKGIKRRNQMHANLRAQQIGN
jgi:hypothetical protein